MAYAAFEDVKLRAGHFAGLFQVEGKRPNEADVTEILADVAEEIDAAIRGRGFDPAAMATSAKDALEDLNAYGALVRALPAANPGPQADQLLQTAQAIWNAAMGARGSITAGTHAVLLQLEAGSGGEHGPAAGNFWDDEPTYGTPVQVAAEDAAFGETNLLPAFHKGQTL